MHDAAFANAALPRRTVILDLPLRDYCLAHELWLLRRNSPIFTGDGFNSSDAVIEAVLICAHTHEELQAMERDWLIWLKIALWRRRIRTADFIQAARDLANYIAAGSAGPPVLEARQPIGSGPRRADGTPFILAVLQFLMLELRLSESQAMNYPCALAKWHYYAFYESRGAVRIKNADEARAENEKDQVEALVAKGVSFAEAFKIVRGEQAAPAPDPSLNPQPSTLNPS